MKQVLRLCALCCIGLLLTGCKEAPGNVQEQADILGGNVHADSAAQPKTEQSDYASLAEIRARLTDDLAANHSQIAVADAFVGGSASMPTYACTLNAVDVTDGTDNPIMRQLVHTLFGDTLTDENTKLTRYNDPLNPDEPPCDRPGDRDGDGRIESANVLFLDLLEYEKSAFGAAGFCSIWGSGKCTGRQTAREESPVTEREAAVYDVYLHPVDADAGYPMQDGEKWSVRDAVAFAEDFYNEQLSAAQIEPFRYAVKYVRVKQRSDGAYAYHIEMMLTDENGNPFDSDTTGPLNFRNETKTAVSLNQPFFFPEAAFCSIHEKGKLDYFTTPDSIRRESVTAQNETLLTLSGAVRILSETLANRKAVKIPCAELCYALFCGGYPYFAEWGVDYQKTGDFWYSEVLCKRTCSFTLRPVWVFRTDYDVIDSMQDGRLMGEKYLVDAVTGEVTVVR